MATKTLEQRLNAALRLDDPPAPAYAAMENRLNEIVGLLQKQIDKTRKRAQVALEPGHLVNAGQQFNVVVHIPKQNQYRETLFRAYFPATGTPVTLDFIARSVKDAGIDVLVMVMGGHSQSCALPRSARPSTLPSSKSAGVLSWPTCLRT